MTDLDPVYEIDLAPELGQLRAAPLERDGETHLLLVHAADAEVDPYMRMFFLPSDTLTLTLLDAAGETVWERDLGRGVVPGVWFCPVLPFDLDGDGHEEVWLVDNVDEEHPLDLISYRLTRLDPHTGEATARRAWPVPEPQKLSHRYRNFLVGGHAGGDPVLVTAQGTYGPMHLQGIGPGLEERWSLDVAADDPGARGSHMCPVLDIDGDGDDELLWGERCLSLADGTEQWCADRDSWAGHSDVIQPTRADGGWLVYTVRESDPDDPPRVVTYDDRGERVWSAVDRGHMDVGWTARTGPDGSREALAIRIGGKSAGTEGFGREGIEEFRFDARTGERRDPAFPRYGALPVDLDGDGAHELVYGGVWMDAGTGSVRDRHGNDLGSVGGRIALAAKVIDRPGEQVLAWEESGTVRLWTDREAVDSPAARERYAHPYYRKAARLGATGYNRGNLGGL
jgi:hypothetical protein